MTISPENRAKFEDMGEAAVKADVIAGKFINTIEMLRDAHAWLKEIHTDWENRERLRFRLLAAVAIVGAAGAWIAALFAFLVWLV